MDGQPNDSDTKPKITGGLFLNNFPVHCQSLYSLLLIKFKGLNSAPSPVLYVFAKITLLFLTTANSLLEMPYSPL
jgi:hypothetical protein